MHDDQIVLDIGTARSLIVDQFPGFRGEVIERLNSTGTVNAIYRIGSSAAARFPLRPLNPADAASQLQREADAMAEFARHSAVASPRPIGLGRPGRGYPMPWSVQSWVDGDVATPTGFAASVPLAHDIADLIAGLRAADTRGRSFAGTGRGGALPDHDAWVEVCLVQSRGLLDVERLRGLWTRFRALPPAGPHVMNHGDLIPANLLVRGERLAGVIDCGGFGPADPSLDLVAVWHLFDAECRAIVRHRLGPDDVAWARGAAWAFQQAIGLVWYYETTNPAMSALGRQTLARLLDDPVC